MRGGVVSAHPVIECPECQAQIDVPVNLTVTTDKDSGAQFIEAEPDLTDVWAHAWTHEEKP